MNLIPIENQTTHQTNKQTQTQTMCFKIWSRVRKGFKCYCGKSYKTSQGLKNHSMVVHNTTSTEALNNVTRPLSPSSGSNGGNSYASQSQLSPNGGTNGSTTTANTISLSTSASPTFTQSVSQTNQITLKAPPTTNLIAVNSLAVSSPPNNSHALLSTHNPNKLVKLNSDCFDGVLVGTKASGKNLIITSVANGTSNGNIIVSAAAATTAIPNAPSTADDSNGNGNGSKINLPSLVNLGILTPATSPKQHTQLTPQISPNHTPASNASNANNHNNNHHHHHNNHNSNNESSLPLTPISPLNKSFNGTASANIANATNNNNNATSPNLNSHGLLANSITADGSMTEDT